MSLLRFEQVQRLFAPRHPGEAANIVIDSADFALQPGETVSLIGPSGAGKTTLLYLAAGLCRPTGGRIEFEGTDLATLSAGALTQLRRTRIGMVFQNNLCLSALPAWENVALPMLLNGHSLREARKQALTLMEQVELGAWFEASTAALSGGQRRRLGLARAMSMQPALLLADEPTTDLDEKTATRIEDVLFGWLARHRCGALIVTHESQIERRTDRVLRLADGRLTPVPGACATPASVPR